MQPESKCYLVLHRHVGWEQYYLTELPHLVKVEQRYAHLYKERLAIVCGVQNFINTC